MNTIRTIKINQSKQICFFFSPDKKATRTILDANILLRSTSYLLNLVNSLIATLPRSAITSGLFATFATRVVEATCYVDQWNQHLKISAVDAIDTVKPEYIYRFLTKGCGLIASNIANETSLCPIGETLKGCYSINIPFNATIDYGTVTDDVLIWVDAEKNFWNSTLRSSCLQEQHTYRYCAGAKKNDIIFYVLAMALMAITFMFVIKFFCSLCCRHRINFDTPHTPEEQKKIDSLKEELHENANKIVNLLNTLTATYQYSPEENDDKTIKKQGFTCSITREILKEAVKLPADMNIYHYFELDSLATWLKTNPTHPLTRQEAHIKDIEPALEKQEEIIKYLENKTKEQKKLQEKQKIYSDLETPLLRDEKEEKEEKEDKEESYFSINYRR